MRPESSTATWPKAKSSCFSPPAAARSASSPASIRPRSGRTGRTSRADLGGPPAPAASLRLRAFEERAHLGAVEVEHLRTRESAAANLVEREHRHVEARAVR